MVNKNEMNSDKDNLESQTSVFDALRITIEGLRDEKMLKHGIIVYSIYVVALVLLFLLFLAIFNDIVVEILYQTTIIFVLLLASGFISTVINEYSNYKKLALATELETLAFNKKLNWFKKETQYY